MPDIARFDFKILATDIDPTVLKTALKGVYTAADLTSVPDHLRSTYFSAAQPTSNTQIVSEKLRDIIAFRRLNLVDDWPFTLQFDVIMCRNVVIYFGDSTKSKIWNRMAHQLKPDGLLVTGHSERLSGPALSKLKLVETTTYQPNTISAPSKGNAPCP